MADLAGKKFLGTGFLQSFGYTECSLLQIWRLPPALSASTSCRGVVIPLRAVGGNSCLPASEPSEFGRAGKSAPRDFVTATRC